MIDKQTIIDDQKKTIHRLQQECTEKTNTILALGDKLKCKEQECESLNADNIYLRDRESKLELAILRRDEKLDQLKDEIEKLKQPSLVVPPTPRMGVSLDDYYKTIDSLLSVQYILAENCKRYRKLLDKTKETEVDKE